MTLPEVMLWNAVRRGAIDGLGFRRQYPKGDYILDFYCPSARLAIEVDGEQHGRDEHRRHDEARDAWLAGEGIRVMRIPASAILDADAFAGVVESIREATAFGKNGGG
jgi:very-short-patch-repair endonuclease